MVKKVNNVQQLANDYVQPKMDKHVCFGGRRFRILSKAFKALYNSTIGRLFKWAMSFRKNKNEALAKNKMIHLSETSRACGVFKEGVPLIQEKNMDFARRLQEAEKFYKKQEAVYAYHLQFKAQGTLALFQIYIDNFESWAKTENVQQRISTDQLNAFLSEIAAIQQFLQKKRDDFIDIKSNSENTNLTLKEVKEHLQEIFQQVGNFYQHVTRWNKKLQKGSAEKKLLVNFAKAFITQLVKQNKIYQEPSSDPALRGFYEIKEKARKALQELKNQEIL